MLVLAAVVLVVGVVGRRNRPRWSLPLPACAMVVLGSIAVVAVIVDATLSGLLVAAALLALAAWDVNHRRANRVVDRALSEFCAILDVLVAMLIVAMLIAVVTLTA